MVGVKEICALLLAGGIGAGTVVTVQEARKPAKVKMARPVPAKPSMATAADRPAYRPPSICIEPFMLRAPDLAPQPLPEIHGAVSWMPAAVVMASDNGWGLFNPWAPPAVPEPGAWAMMIAGFGLVGIALRRRAVA